MWIASDVRTSSYRLRWVLERYVPPKGHFLGQIPHPIHSRSEINAIFDSGVTSIHSFPVLTTGHDFLHSCRHFFTAKKLCQSAEPRNLLSERKSSYLRFALLNEKNPISNPILKEKRRKSKKIESKNPYLIRAHNSNTSHPSAQKTPLHAERKNQKGHTE